MIRGKRTRKQEHGIITAFTVMLKNLMTIPKNVGCQASTLRDAKYKLHFCTITQYKGNGLLSDVYTERLYPNITQLITRGKNYLECCCKEP